MELDKQDLERLLANDLLVIMQEETAEAFTKKEWDGKRWKERAHDYGVGSLMIRDGTLKRSIIIEAEGNRVVINSNTLYANIHNAGGVIHTPVTDKMRRYFWAIYYKTKEPMYKALALTKKQTLTIRIPKRQFAGVTAKTKRKWRESVDLRLKSLDLIGAIKAKIR
nr:MAG TPA: tail morphogenesis protein [Caudoviricetes sp.]